jgi:hypothetical protein
MAEGYTLLIYLSVGAALVGGALLLGPAFTNPSGFNLGTAFTGLKCNERDTCTNVSGRGGYKHCKCGCLGGKPIRGSAGGLPSSWVIGPATSCTACHTRCMQLRRLHNSQWTN